MISLVKHVTKQAKKTAHMIARVLNVVNCYIVFRVHVLLTDITENIKLYFI